VPCTGSSTPPRRATRPNTIHSYLTVTQHRVIESQKTREIASLRCYGVAQVSDELLATVNEEAAPYVVTVQAYDALLKEMRTAVDSGGSRMLLCANSSLAIHDVVPEAQKTTKSSPVAYWKV
jgi:hypothetical protein